MIRSRVWLLSLAAALFVAAPALAYSWPVLFGLPALFGQETSRSQADSQLPAGHYASGPGSNLASECQAPVPRMPYADQTPSRCLPTLCGTECCDFAGDCLSTWQRLWSQGKFREALDLAKCAVQAAPDNMDIRHAYVVSQMVNQQPTYTQRLTGQFAPFGTCGVVPAVAQAPLRIPGPATSTVEVEFECPYAKCPLTGIFEAIFGGCEARKSSRCKECIADEECCVATERTQAAEGHGEAPPRRTVAQQPPQVIWILQEPIMGHHAVVGLPPMAAPPPSSVVPPLPPPFLAPPPPLVINENGLPYVPVPIAEAPMYSERVRQTEFTELSGKLPADVRIEQTGRHVHVATAHYDVYCERVRGGAQGQLVLEGNVRLMSQRHGQTMRITAQRVILNVKDDQFVVEQADGMESSRINIAPVGRSADERMHELLNENEYRGQWMRGQTLPTHHLTPIRVHGGVGP